MFIGFNGLRKDTSFLVIFNRGAAVGKDIGAGRGGGGGGGAGATNVAAFIAVFQISASILSSAQDSFEILWLAQCVRIRVNNSNIESLIPCSFVSNGAWWVWTESVQQQ